MFPFLAILVYPVSFFVTHCYIIFISLVHYRYCLLYFVLTIFLYSRIFCSPIFFLSFSFSFIASPFLYFCSFSVSFPLFYSCFLSFLSLFHFCIVFLFLSLFIIILLFLVPPFLRSLSLLFFRYQLFQFG